ncbi:MAG: hypothetical protein QM690_22160 [Sphingobium sp.]
MANAWILAPLPIVSAAASSTAAGHDPAFVGNDHMGVVWKSGPEASPHLRIDLGADEAVDAALLMGCTGAQAGWQMGVSAATSAQGTGFPPGSFIAPDEPLLAGSEMLPSGRGVGLWVPDGIPPLSRHIDFRIDQGSTAPVTIGRVAAGKRIMLDRNFSFGAALGVKDLGKADFSQRGVLLRSRGAKLRTVNLKFGALHRDEVEAAILPLLALAGTTEPVALVLDPAPHEMRQRRIYFGMLVGPQLDAIWARAGGFEWSANLVSLI